MTDKKNEETKKEEEKQEQQEEIPKMGEIPEPDFISFIFTLSTHAQIGLGLIPNPISKKVEVDLNLAKYQIDIIEMLHKKTKGNLSQDEEKFVGDILHNLKMAYVGSIQKDEKKET